MVTVNKYIVLNRNEVNEYLNSTEYGILMALLSKINQGCIDKSVSMKEYLVCNIKKIDFDKFNFKNGIDIGTRI